MTKEDKDLLLRDLCSRLPYGVKMNHIADDEYSPNTLIGIAKDMITLEGLGGYECVNVEHYKPYLFPLSSMTPEQRKEYESLCIEKTSECNDLYDIVFAKDYYDTIESIEFLYKNHIDIKGLIPKGRAIDATNLNIY